MLTLKLDKEQRNALAENLDSAISDLSYEIGNTDSFDFRAALKRKKKSLQEIRKQLDEEFVSAD